MNIRGIFVLIGITLLTGFIIVGTSCAPRQVSTPIAPEKPIVKQAKPQQIKEVEPAPEVAPGIITEETHPVEEAEEIKEPSEVVQPTSTSEESAGPQLEPGQKVEELPVFVPIHNYAGPTDAGSAAANTEQSDKEVSEFTPVTNKTGPQPSPGITTKELPPFMPETSETGPTAGSSESK